MLLRSLRALCFAPGGPGSIWNYLGAPVRSTGVSGSFACGFRTDLHFADTGAPPPEDTPEQETIDPLRSDLPCAPDPIQTRAHWQKVGVEHSGGKASGKATGFYNKHHKYSEQWHPWHPFQAADDFQHDQSCSQQTTMWIDQPLNCGLDNFNIELFQSAYPL
jgi:hypothetical protein